MNNYPDELNYGIESNRLNYNVYMYSLDTTDFLNPTETYYRVWDFIGSYSAGTSGIKIISSSVDIHDETGSIFFQNPPQGITETLVEETTKVQIAEQLKMMIAGFLKYLIVLVISVIAFWKGWQFLSTQLRKA